MKNDVYSYFTEESEHITLPLFPKFYSCADPIISSMKNPTKKEIFSNRVVAAANHYLVKYCSFYTEKGWCSLTDEQLTIHHCLLEDVIYKIAVLNGAFNRKHKNFKRLDKIALTEVETRYDLKH